MLIKTLQETISTLDKLISITLEDIENIKQAKHEEVFKNTKANKAVNTGDSLEYVIASASVICAIL